jgi:hypothetical protein
MSRHRTFLFLAMLVTLTLSGSGTAGGITGFAREAPSVNGATASAATNTRDAVLPYQPRPHVMSAARRGDSERVGSTPLVAVSARAGAKPGRPDAGHGGAAFRQTSALTSGSRAPPIASSFSLR